MHFSFEGFRTLQYVLQYQKGKFFIEEGSVFFIVDNLKLQVNTAEELFIINEIFFEGCYNFIVSSQSVIVLDIGMNVGFASVYFANKTYVDKVYGFEPFPQTYAAAEINLGYNLQQAEKIVPLNYGLGNATKEVQVPYSSVAIGRNKSTLSEVGESNLPSVKIKIKHALKVIKKCIEENKDKTFLIKMDCEGAEFDIFSSLSKEPIHEQVKGFMIEWHFSEPDVITQFLEDCKFKMIKTNLGIESGLIYAFR